MAKGNLFLGTAAKSVGDVVMYRREGSQVSRVRVRKIANPKTDAQCKQRAIMSAVVKFYQPLADTLERSWQGLSTAKSYAKFLKTNANIGRAGEYYLPKGSGLLPFPYQLSSGTVTSIKCSVDSAEGLFLLPAATESSITLSTVGDLSAQFVAMGANAGDVITIIAIGSDTNGNYTTFVGQFAVDITSSEQLAVIMPKIIFNNISSGTRNMTFGVPSNDVVGTACIISRPKDGDWLRSTSKLSVDRTILASLITTEAKAAAIASYKGAAASDNPLVYLDGDELQ